MENEPNSVVGGTLWYAGYQALLSGAVDEDVQAVSSALKLDEEVGGNVDAEVDGQDGGPSPSWFAPAPRVPLPPVESGLTLTDSARVDGNLTYESSTEAQVSPAARIGGEVIRNERPTAEEPARTLTDVVLDALRNFLALVLVGLLLVWLARSGPAAWPTPFRPGPWPAWAGAFWAS